MKSNNNLKKIDLVLVKQKYPELKDIFFFLDKLTFELILKKTKKSRDTVLFVNYFDNKQYYVRLADVNKILAECYFDFYLEPIFSKIINLPDFSLKKTHERFKLFFKCLFFAVKNGLERNLKIEKNFVFICIQNLSKIDNDKEFLSFSQFSAEILSTLNLNHIIELFKDHLNISSETIIFDNFTENSRSYKRYKHYFDLIYLLDKENISLILKKDLCLNFIVLISFKNANCYIDTNVYNDNSYVLRMPDSLKKLPEIEKICQRFNNL